MIAVIRLWDGNPESLGLIPMAGTSLTRNIYVSRIPVINCSVFCDASIGVLAEPKIVAIVGLVDLSEGYSCYN